MSATVELEVSVHGWSMPPSPLPQADGDGTDERWSPWRRGVLAIDWGSAPDFVLYGFNCAGQPRRR